MKKQPNQQPCCQGDELLCISIPGAIEVIVSGKTLIKLDPPCLKIMGNNNTKQVNQLRNVLEFLQISAQNISRK